MQKLITDVSAASAADALAHFSRRLSFETDCWDTHQALLLGETGFVILDVRGPDLYAKGHVPGAINLPRGKMTDRRMAAWDADITFVVYCAGPHCNGANKAAIQLARMGRPVKEMIGGITGWADEGFAFAEGPEPGTIAEVEGVAIT